ncbi:MAG: hypothetical protein VB111_08235 [Clostridiaceae bacterium]|nr:hypothetical protein [Clostridiaceae bacterium]
MNDHYVNLANAIIVQAARDYREALDFLKRHPHTPDFDTKDAQSDKRKRVLRDKIIKNEGVRDEVERFFRSGWFEMLSNLDGEILLRQIRAMEVR